MEVVFPSGEIKKSFDISILDDSVLEGLEVFTVVLSSTKSNVLIMEGSNTATVSIIDTDRKCRHMYLFTHFVIAVQESIIIYF